MYIYIFIYMLCFVQLCYIHYYKYFINCSKSKLQSVIVNITIAMFKEFHFKQQPQVLIVSVILYFLEIFKQN